MRRLILSITLALFCTVTNAQQCGFDQINERLMGADPAYKAAVEKNKAEWAKFAENAPKQKLLVTGTDTIFEIPVVIHVIHTGGPIGSQYNPTDAQLISLIDYTNKCYQATWPGYPTTANGGTRIPFQFTLAKRDPNCQPTTGILRVDGSAVPNYSADGIELGGGPGASETAIKALSKWPNDRYYNVWVVTNIGGGNGTAGYAYYPGAGPGVDGTVILAGVAQAGSSTLAHEMGHGMGLAHTFEGDNNGTTCPLNVNCNVDGDGVCDTEPHMRNVSCSDNINPCTNQPYDSTKFNFMSYTGGCRDRFTPGQRTKVLYNLHVNRHSLMLSEGAQAPPQAPPTACIPTSNNPSSNQNVGPQVVVFNTINRTSGGYNTEGIHVQDICNGRTDVYTGASYPISVTTGPFVEDVRVYIDYNNDGVFQVPAEEVFTHTGSVTNETHSGSITIPSTNVFLCQPIRMRVLSDITATPLMLPCGPLERGQAEDYVITIKPPTSSTISIATTGTFPNCEDSLVTFTAALANVPSTSSVFWLVNGVAIGAGSPWFATGLQAGDVVTAKTYSMNATCNTPDTVVSNGITITTVPGPPPPTISFINGDLVSNIAPVYWFGPNGLIPGVSSAVYHPTQAGNYYAKAVGNPCPSDTSNVLNVSLLDIPGLDMSSIKLYPNPVKDELVIEAGNNKNLQLTLYSPLGQALQKYEVRDVTRYVIPMQKLANGIYFLGITDDHDRRGTTRIQVLR